MTTPRAAAIFSTVGTLAAAPGQRTATYAVCLDDALLRKWVPGDTTTADGYAIISATGGYTGRWFQVPGDNLGADLTDAAEDIAATGKLVRILAAGTLTSNRVKTLTTTGAVAGHVLTVVCRDVEAFTCAFVNGGPAAGTLVTKSAAEAWTFDFRFDGDDWSLIRQAQLP